jgi:hypothetical protein
MPFRASSIGAVIPPLVFPLFNRIIMCPAIDLIAISTRKKQIRTMIHIIAFFLGLWFPLFQAYPCPNRGGNAVDRHPGSFLERNRRKARLLITLT